MTGAQLTPHRTVRQAAPRRPSTGRLATLTAQFVVLALATHGRASFAQPLTAGPEFQVSTVTAGRQSYASVASAGNGSFVVAWDKRLGSNLAVAAQRFDRSGLRRGDEILVTPRGYNAGVAMDADGDFIVTWDGFPAYLQRFDRTGAAQGGPFNITESFGGGAVEMADDGSFVVAWSTYGSDISASRFDRRGTSIGDPIDVGGSSDGWYPGIGINAAGDFVVVWSQGLRTGLAGVSGRGIFGQLYDRAGVPIGGAFQVSATTTYGHYRPSVAMAPNGSFVVVWNFSTGVRDDVVARRYDSAGTPIGGEFLANTYTPLAQHSPDVAIGPDRSFVVVWASQRQDGDDSGVFGQLFDREGTRVGLEFQVNSHTLESQLHPSAAFAPTGDLLVAWHSFHNDTDGDVFARRYRAGSASGGDADGDGVDDFIDNCPTVPNADQTDADSDLFGDACVAPDVVIHPTARLGANPIIDRGTVLGQGVVIGDDAVIGEEVRLERQSRAGSRVELGDRVAVGIRAQIGNDAAIGADTRIETGASIGDGVTIGDGVAILRNAVVGPRATIGPLVVLEIGARIGRGATVEMGARVGRRAIVRPGAVVPAGTTVAPGTTFP